jgi:phage terminase small subunit
MDMSEVGKIPDEYCGAAMRALGTDKMRKFAFIMGSGMTTAAEAAREAGYADKGGEGAKRAAHKLLQDEAVQAAVRETAVKALGGLVPAALRALQEILDDSAHPQGARTAETILDRTGFSPKVQTEITVTHRADTAQLEEFARRLAIESGHPPDFFLPSPKIIDAEPV